jgi:hypothetical protein
MNPQTKTQLDVALQSVGLIESCTPVPNVYMARCVCLEMQCSVGVFVVAGAFHVDLLCVGSVVPSEERSTVSRELDTGEICEYIHQTAERMWNDQARQMYREYCEDHVPFGPIQGARSFPPSGPYGDGE